MKSVRSYQREIRKLRDLVTGMQWVQPMHNGSQSCAGCGAMRHLGCARDCPIAQITRDFGTPEMPTHQHKCGDCSYVFEHGDDMVGNHPAHMCPLCGTGPWLYKYDAPKKARRG